ncbi:MAG: DUF262 domain-containing protein [Chloroflexi bacterium]|nr:MAG: DUF262 domain-containing protein [Chloroflexota bacterium]
MGLQEEIDAKAKEIHTDAYAMSIGEIVSMYKSGELDIHPEFQRYFRWTAQQKSRLIESILLGIPLPSIFVSQREDGVWDVIDGLQRLSTLFEFMGEWRDESGQVRTAPALLATAYLPALAGKYWENEDDEGQSLTNAQRLAIKRSKLAINIIKKESDPGTKYELFQRLNTGGTQLTPQEVRNCVLITVNRDFHIWFERLAGLSVFRDSIATSERQDEERYDLELALRFFACDATDEKLKQIVDVGDFLTARMLTFAMDDKFDQRAAEARFAGTFALLAEALGDDAFRRYDPVKQRFLGGFSVSAFETIAVGLAASLDGWQGLNPPDRNARLRERIQSMWANADWRAHSGSGIRGNLRIPYVVPWGRAHFRP